MKREIFWKTKHTPAQSLQENIETTYLVVGGGITGVMAATLLLKKGVSAQDIVLIEQGEIGSGSTGRSAGMLVPEPENETNIGWDGFIERFGKETISSYRRAHLHAIDLLEEIIKENDIHADALRCDFIVLGRDAEAKKRIVADTHARESLGEHPDKLEGERLQKEIRSPYFIFGERSQQGLSVNPLALVQGIADALRNKGVRVYEHTPLLTLGQDHARTKGGSVSFKTVILAQGMGTVHPQLHKYATTIVVTEPLSHEHLVSLALEDKDMFIDDEGKESFHYGKVTADNRLLLGFGDTQIKHISADVELEESHVKSIEEFLKEFSPHVPLRIDYAWSGGYALSSNLLPIVEVNKGKVLINGAGIQLGSIVATQYALEKLLTGAKHEFDILWENVTTS